MPNKLHIVTAVAVIQRSDGKILLLKRRADEIAYPGCYTFPGGKVEDNDTISETLEKEVAEECGLKLKPGYILIKEKSILRPDNQTSKSLSFLCEVEDDSRVVIDKGDFTGFLWADIDDLAKIEHVGIEAEFNKVEEINSVDVDINHFFIDTDKAILT